MPYPSLDRIIEIYNFIQNLIQVGRLNTGIKLKNISDVLVLIEDHYVADVKYVISSELKRVYIDDPYLSNKFRKGSTDKSGISWSYIGIKNK